MAEGLPSNFEEDCCVICSAWCLKVLVILLYDLLMQPRSVVTPIHYLALVLSRTMYLGQGGLLVNEKSQLGFSISLYMMR